MFATHPFKTLSPFWNVESLFIVPPLNQRLKTCPPYATRTLTYGLFAWGGKADSYSQAAETIVSAKEEVRGGAILSSRASFWR